MDRNRKGKELSNKDWESASPLGSDRPLEGRPHPPGLQARARREPGHRSRGRCRGAPCRRTPLGKTLKAAETNLLQIGKEPNLNSPSEFVADKGYHSRACSRNSTTVPGKPGSPSRNARARTGGVAITRPSWRCTTTEYGWARARVARRPSAGQNWLNAAFQHALDRGGMRKNGRVIGRTSRNATGAYCGVQLRPADTASERLRHPQGGNRCLESHLSWRGDENC